MISLFPLGRIITCVAIIYSIFPILILYFTWPADNTQTVYSSIKAALSGSGALGLILYLFFSYAWRGVWRLVPQLNKSVFPNLNGRWDMTIEWNRGEKSGVAQATAIIRQDFLKISMEVHSKDSDSETLLAQPKKDAESGRPVLYYVYRVIPKQVAGKDDPPYDGAAILKLAPDDQIGLQGNYFTNARTQGHFRLMRPDSQIGAKSS
jgi:hypothetical protein